LVNLRRAKDGANFWTPCILLHYFYHYYYHYHYTVPLRLLLFRGVGGQNLLEKTKDKELIKSNLMMMVQLHVDRQAIMLQSRGKEDEEFVADLEYLVNALAAKLEDIR